MANNDNNSANHESLDDFINESQPIKDEKLPPKTITRISGDKILGWFVVLVIVGLLWLVYWLAVTMRQAMKSNQDFRTAVYALAVVVVFIALIAAQNK